MMMKLKLSGAIKKTINPKIKRRVFKLKDINPYKFGATMKKLCTVALFLCIVNVKRMQKRSMNDMDETFHKTNVTLQRKRKNNPKYITTMEKKTTKQQAVEKINNSYSQCNSDLSIR